MTVALWWVRRDLRLTDNQAFAAAIAQADHVLPVFILDPALLHSRYAGEKRLAFLFGGLKSLDADLRRRGSRLVVRRGQPADELAALTRDTGADAVFAEADYSPYARRRDQRVTQRVPLHLIDGLTFQPPGAVLKADGKPYTVYTPFSKAWKAQAMPRASLLHLAPDHFSESVAVKSEPLPDIASQDGDTGFPPGESEALRRLAVFTDGEGAPVYAYSETRNLMALVGTSGLSPYLRFGMISARQAVVRALECVEAAKGDAARKGAETWLNELIWREFFIHILYHFPAVRRESFSEPLRDIPWHNDHAEFAAWKAGRTGYPVVDAAMRQLAQTGWMHNRARMIVASFLTKDLLIDWRWGEQWFMQQLLDGDPAANNGGWQWAAGTGTDAAPYFRIFNPVLQGQKFDPNGDYVRQWVPELARVPLKHLHSPWQMSAAEQTAAGCTIGRDYPAPVVDHGWARQRTLQAYGQAKNSR